LSRNAFNNTEIDDIAIAPAANIGFNSIPKNGYKTPAATGMSRTL
jgi:hypothetical protein